jgi:hypothetical protein
MSTLNKSLGHAKSSQSSLVVSWQRIYNSPTVTRAHIKSSFHSRTSKSSERSRFLSHLSYRLRNSRSNSLLQLPTISFPSLLGCLTAGSLLSIVSFQLSQFSNCYLKRLSQVQVTLRLAVYRQLTRLGVSPLETHNQRELGTSLYSFRADPTENTIS